MKRIICTIAMAMASTLSHAKSIEYKHKVNLTQDLSEYGTCFLKCASQENLPNRVQPLSLRAMQPRLERCLDAFCEQATGMILRGVSVDMGLIITPWNIAPRTWIPHIATDDEVIVYADNSNRLDNVDAGFVGTMREFVVSILEAPCFDFAHQKFIVLKHMIDELQPHKEFLITEEKTK